MTKTTEPFADVPDPDFGDVGRPRGARIEGLRAFEDAAVRHLCANLGLSPLVRRLREEGSARTDSPGCTFAMLDQVANFPVKLRVGRLLAVRFITLPDLFNRFEKTPVGLALSAVCAGELDADAGPVGLVFRWAGIRDDQGKQQTIKGGKFMVAHTAASELSPGGVRLVASVPLGAIRQAVTVERLDDLLANYRGWRLGE